jgi:NIPSNAP protein
MIYELRTYTLAPGKQGEYLKLNAEVGRKIRGDTYGKFEGGWTTEFGMLNQYVHLWSYPSLDERERLRGALQKNEGWTKEYLPKIRPLMLAQENKILSAVTPFKPPTDSGNVYELRWYRAQVGKLADWLALARGVLPSREKYSRNVCYWQTEAGQLNEAVHLWVYKDLNERAAARARALADPEWQAFLGKALPLLVSMQAVVLVPTPVSPMK